MVRCRQQSQANKAQRTTSVICFSFGLTMRVRPTVAPEDFSEFTAKTSDECSPAERRTRLSSPTEAMIRIPCGTFAPGTKSSSDLPAMQKRDGLTVRRGAARRPLSLVQSVAMPETAYTNRNMDNAQQKAATGRGSGDAGRFDLHLTLTPKATEKKNAPARLNLGASLSSPPPPPPSASFVFSS